jgi:hypothetical protein
MGAVRSFSLDFIYRNVNFIKSIRLELVKMRDGCYRENNSINSKS